MSEGSGTYKFTIDEGKKVFVAYAEGLFDMNQGVNFCNEFIANANSIANQSEYALIVDVKDVRPSSAEVQAALGNALGLYSSDDFKFKQRFMTKLASAIAQSQIVRLTKDIPGFDSKVTFVATKEEVLSKL